MLYDNDKKKYEMQMKIKDAFVKGKEKLQDKKNREAAALQAKRQADERAAEKIIEGIPSKVLESASKDESFTKIMELKNYIHSDKLNFSDYTTKLVYDFCRDSGLNPSVEYIEYFPDGSPPAYVMFINIGQDKRKII